MRITKFGHSCLLVEEGEARILIDPGSYSSGHTELTNLDAILITHEHPDHCDIESVQTLLSKNTGAPIYTNSGVGKKLEEAGIGYDLLEDGKNTMVKGVPVGAFGKDHAEIYYKMPIVRNTGFMIGERFFYPGDTVVTVPNKNVEILALPVVAPWLRMADALDYAINLKPKTCFPVHDGFLKIPGPFHMLPERLLTGKGIQFAVLEHGKPMSF